MDISLLIITKSLSGNAEDIQSRLAGPQHSRDRLEPRVVVGQLGLGTVAQPAAGHRVAHLLVLQRLLLHALGAALPELKEAPGFVERLPHAGELERARRVLAQQL